MKSAAGASAQDALRAASKSGAIEKDFSLIGSRNTDSISDALKKKTKVVHINCSYCDGYDETVPLQQPRKQHDLMFGDDKEFRLLCGKCFIKICDKMLITPKDKESLKKK